MSQRPFCLTPFPEGENAPDLKICGSIDREANHLSLHYKLIGDTAALLLPDLAEVPLRKDNLWQTTCFEFFLAEDGRGRYWEFNLSPSGHWNVYTFSDYRQNMREEPAYTALPFILKKEEGALEITLRINLGDIVDVEKSLDAALCAVIHYRHGGFAYWALTHCGARPDFHLRDSFIIKL